MLELIRSENSTEPGREVYTPSRLLAPCDRQRVLERGADYYINIDHAVDALRGRMIHALIETAPPVSGTLATLREVRLETTIDMPGGPALAGVAEAAFTGKADFVCLLRQVGDVAEAKIVDYKTSTYLSAGFLDAEENEYTWKHVLQINMYRWLVERALAAALALPLTVVVVELELVYMDMKRIIRFNSSTDITYGGKTYRKLSMFEPEHIEREIVRLIQARRALPALPPRLAGYPGHWACARCPVFDLCSSEHESEHGDEKA